MPALPHGRQPAVSIFAEHLPGGELPSSPIRRARKLVILKGIVPLPSDQISLNLMPAGKTNHRGQRFEDAMISKARMMSLAFPTSSVELEILKTIAIFCGLGLLVALCLASYGLDLSAGFF
jgi:hypothetical protein